MDKKELLKKEIGAFSLCLGLAFLFLLICSACSFIFAFNPSVDYNWYETLGRGVVNGKVPYRDLFEHKGPVLYFMYAFFTLLGSTRIACFFAEVVFGAIFLYFCYKLIRKYFGIKASIFMTTLLAFFTFCPGSFSYGGSTAEEFALPIIAYMLYVFHGYLENPDANKFKWYQSLIIGLGVGFIFWVKFSILILPAILLLTWLIYGLCSKRYKDTLLSLVFMVVGFIIISMPVAIYYLANGAISNLINVYFLINIKSYGSAVNWRNTSVIEMFFETWWRGILFILLVAFALLILVLAYRKQKRSVLFLVPGIISTIILLCLHNAFYYYYLFLAPYFCVMLIFFGKVVPLCLEKIFKNHKFTFTNPFKITFLLVSIIFIFILSLGCSNNSYAYFYNREDYVQFRVADDINNYGIDNPSVYCFNIADYGFYNVLDKMPSEYFYARSYFHPDIFPEMYEAFNAALKSQKFDFVITTNECMAIYDFIPNYYTVYKSYSDDIFGFVLLINNNLI